MNNAEKAAMLKEARALIDTPEKWWDGQDRAIAGDERCALEATWAVNSEGHGYSLGAELALTLGANPDRDRIDLKILVQDYNDSHTHAEVLALFDTTIARLEATT